jgi:hypothetical protein
MSTVAPISFAGSQLAETCHVCAPQARRAPVLRRAAAADFYDPLWLRRAI